MNFLSQSILRVEIRQKIMTSNLFLKTGFLDKNIVQ